MCKSTSHLVPLTAQKGLLHIEDNAAPKKQSFGTKAMQMVLLGIISVYKGGISPYLPSACRYAPSCSVYAAQAIAKHGPLKGLRLALKRISRCQPWGGTGYDPVP